MTAHGRQGDKFYRNAAGDCFFVDRNKDVFWRRGENISSFEVESAVNGYPSALKSAAVAVPSEHTKDEIKVAVTPKPGETVDPTELSLHRTGKIREGPTEPQ